MITNRDWDDALDAWTENERGRLERALRVYAPPEKRVRLLPIAAGIVIAVLVGFLVESRRELQQPYVHPTRHELRAMHARGAAEPPVYELPDDEERYLLALMTFDAARIELSRGTNVVWTAEVSGREVELSIPRALLRDEVNRIDLYDAKHMRIETYRIRVRGKLVERERR